MKAIALVSGGLDSALSAKLIKEQGIEVWGLYFKTSFSQCQSPTPEDLNKGLLTLADNLGIELKVIDISEDFFQMLQNPKHGFGSNMNPCIDCKIMMLKKSRELMQELGVSFIVTGEVLGQRPMSQHRGALKIIEKESGLEGLLLRPLSAKLLDETIPEKEGWIDRTRLLSFSGRTRKPQIELARNLDIKDYSCPAGGCLLTDPEFSKRLKDLMRYGQLDLNNVELLKVGRHFRLAPEAKLIVGRNEKENGIIEQLAKEEDYLFRPLKLAGPTAVGRGKFDEQLIRAACAITCRYCDLIKPCVTKGTTAVSQSDAGNGADRSIGDAGLNNGETEADIVYRRIPEEDKVLKISLKGDMFLNN